MKQKLNDFLLLLKKDRKTQILTGVGLLFLIALMFSSPKHRRFAAPRNQIQLGAGTSAENESYNDIINAFDERVGNLETVVQEQGERQKESDQRMKEFEDRTSSILVKMLDKISQNDAAAASAGGNTSITPIELGDDESAAGTEQPTDELEPFGLEKKAPLPPPEPPKSRSAFIGKGDAVRVKILAGVNAPTDGTPYPVIMKTIGNVTGPDGTSLPLGEARIIAAAQGSLADGRALFRLTDLSIRLPSGERREYQIDGWIVGEDGIRGMPGRLIDHLGELLGVSMVTGAARGAATGMAAAQLSSVETTSGVSTFVSGNTTNLMAAEAAKAGIGDFSQVLEERARLLVPHVEILSGREATAVFAKSVTIDGLYDELAQGEEFESSLD